QFSTKYPHFDLTSCIGREYKNVQLADIVDSNELLLDLAHTISERGVVFFRDQSLTLYQQKVLIQRLGELTGKPESSRLHIHPMMNSEMAENKELKEGRDDNEVSVISVQHGFKRYNESKFHIRTSDLCSTNIDVGAGDTLWASGYEMYQRLSPPVQKFFESLTVTFAQPLYQTTAKTNGFRLFQGPRGSPENTTSTYEAVHPMIRTNPVTGRNSIYGFGQHVSHVNGVTEAESDWILEKVRKTLVENHDLQVRFRWSANAVAIWDNRSVFHTATYDHVGPRVGVRVCGIGERPFFSPGN
ncbi:hypothetical protein AC578_3659, partial [Pseudocercospora eumusae]